MKQLISAAAMGAVVLALATSSTMALTFKKGQVLGSDGKIYDGASPEETARLIKNAADGGESAGVRGNNLFVVMDDELVFWRKNLFKFPSEAAGKRYIREQTRLINILHAFFI